MSLCQYVTPNRICFSCRKMRFRDNQQTPLQNIKTWSKTATKGSQRFRFFVRKAVNLQGHFNLLSQLHSAQTAQCLTLCFPRNSIRF